MYYSYPFPGVTYLPKTTRTTKLINLDYRYLNGLQLMIFLGKCVLPPSGSGYLSYMGHIYIDMPYDKTNAEYKKVENYLENEDGSSRIEGVRFLLFPLSRA